MVFLRKKLSFLEASCWSLLVVKGGEGERFVSLLLYSDNHKGCGFQFLHETADWASVLTLAFFSSDFNEARLEGGGFAPSSVAVTYQYSSGIKFTDFVPRDHRIMRTATDWTRPGAQTLVLPFPRGGG